MFIWCFSVWACVLSFKNVLTEDPVVCEAMGGQNGSCVALPLCPQYIALLKESTTTQVGLNITQMYRCGFDGLNVKICCPQSAVDINEDLKSIQTDANDFVDEFPSSCGTTDTVRYQCGPELEYLLNARPAYKGISRWMALLGYIENSDNVWKCGGSIITQRHVLTAGHCIKKSLYVVRLGEINLIEKQIFLNDPQPVDFLVKRTILHEKYSTFHNDIGIVVLAKDVQYTEHISPVCLPLPSFYRENTEDNHHGTVTGWGVTESGKQSLQLLYAEVKLYDNDECRQIYKGNFTIDERVLCAGESMTDSCQGDSGGPLVWKYCIGSEDHHQHYQGIDKYFQIGIVSYGFKCEFSRFKGVYTNVAYFLPWIEEKVLGNLSGS